MSKSITIIPPSEGRPETLRVAAYCRVSTDMEEQASSYASQIRSYTELISQHEGWELVDIYADEGLTGTRMDQREDFNRMMADCRKGKIDRVLVKSISRFARNTRDCLAALRELARLGVTVQFEKENIDTGTLTTELMVSVSGSLAQQESMSISQSIHQGYRRRMERGEFITTKPPYGYRLVNRRDLEIIPEEAEIVRWVFDAYLGGQSARDIANELIRRGVRDRKGNVHWTTREIYYWLSNEKYIGDALLQKTYTTDCISKTVRKNQGERAMVYVENNHPPIIPKEIFYQARAEMARRSSKRKVMQKTAKTEQGKYSAKYALSELLVCGECGTPYKRCTWARNGKKRIVWRCVSRLEFGTKYCHASPTMDEEKLHQAILESINIFVLAGQGLGTELLDLAGLVRQGGSADNIDTLALRRRLEALTTEQASLIEQALALEDMENEELNAQLKAVTEEKEDILRQLGALRQDEERRASQEAGRRELAEWLEQQQTEFAGYEDAITRKYVERITVLDAETIRVKFKYTDVEIDRTIRK